MGPETISSFHLLLTILNSVDTITIHILQMMTWDREVE